jgi:hypothetical protein
MAECGFVIALSLLVPTVISTAICYSVASTDEGQQKRRRSGGSEGAASFAMLKRPIHREY